MLHLCYVPHQTLAEFSSEICLVNGICLVPLKLLQSVAAVVVLVVVAWLCLPTFAVPILPLGRRGKQ
jgi:hypothetical protein